MSSETMFVTRRFFARTGILGAAGLATAALAKGQDLETYRKLGLDKGFSWTGEINGRSPAEFRATLDAPGDRQYNPCAEAYPAAGTPRGSVKNTEKWAQSRIFSGTERDLWIYQSAQLDSSTEAPDLMVFNDGGAYVDPSGSVRVPAVLDTLTHVGELRPVVAVFVQPGKRIVPRDLSDPERGRQRSLEYDSLTDAYLRFLLEELLPFVEAEIDRPLSSDPSRRMICGISSGGICAFTAAWLDPTAFGRVLSHCGSFTNIRGGTTIPIW